MDIDPCLQKPIEQSKHQKPMFDLTSPAQHYLTFSMMVETHKT